MKYEKGQMVELSWMDKEGHARWLYMVAEYMYDDRTQFIKEDGSHFMEFEPKKENETEDKEPDSKDNYNIKVIPLYKNGQPVFSKRSFFGLGRYTFEPTTKGGK